MFNHPLNQRLSRPQSTFLYPDVGLVNENIKYVYY